MKKAMIGVVTLIVSFGHLFAAEKPASKAAPDHFAQVYKDYWPHFLSSRRHIKVTRGSFEKRFDSFSKVEEDDRANAMVKAALDFEADGDFRKALQIYHKIIDRFPNTLYRVSDSGVFIPIRRYCQYRLLSMEGEDLEFYRTLFDARARDAFEQALRQYSLIGFQEVVDSMLATTWGDNALLELGRAALDRGDYEEALERFELIRKFFPGSDSDTSALRLMMAYSAKRLGRPVAGAGGGEKIRGTLTPEQVSRFEATVKSARPQSTNTSLKSVALFPLSANTYLPLPAVKDPLCLSKPVWRREHPGITRSTLIRSMPTVFKNSVIYRHKNVVRCRSLLNGSVRWTSDLGGHHPWTWRTSKYYPLEEVHVQDGLVFTNMIKGGASLVALDVGSGQLQWAAGPMASATLQDRLTRFEAAPAGGPQTVFAGYIQDNIEGDTHTDTAYGMRAFESRTGRVLWDRLLCRLTPGKFTAGFAVKYVNRIRSFASPPTLHQGTIYYNTNAGTVAAMDALSGNIKWLFRYPYSAALHDATRPARHPELWKPQRPIVWGDKLIVAPMDSLRITAVDRATGKTVWSRLKGKPYAGHGGHQYLKHAWILGPTKQGHLIIVYDGRWGPVELIEADTGKLIWASPDLVKADASPVMNWEVHSGVKIQKRKFDLGARPLLTDDGRLYVTTHAHLKMGRLGKDGLRCEGRAFNLACVDLNGRSIVNQRRYYDANIQAVANWLINTEAKMVHESRKDPTSAKIIKAEVPPNAHGAFLPMVRLPFAWRGLPFELRIDARGIEMHYTRGSVDRVLAKGKTSDDLFQKAELALYDNRPDEALGLLTACMKVLSPQDLEFRKRVKQVLHRVHLQLARRSIRGSNFTESLKHALGMLNTAGTLKEELHSLFVFAEANEQQEKPAVAARTLRNIIGYYGKREFAIAALNWNPSGDVMKPARYVLDRMAKRHQVDLYKKEIAGPLAVRKKSLPLYLSAASPLPRTVALEAGALATDRLKGLLKRYPEFAKAFEETARSELDGAAAEDRVTILREFPSTKASQEHLDAVAKNAGDLSRRKAWKLVDLAEMAGLKVPKALPIQGDFTQAVRVHKPLRISDKSKELEIGDSSVLKMLLKRRDDGKRHAHLLFIGGRARKRLDNKFEVTCLDQNTGKIVWTRSNIRLKGRGQEAGFAEAFVSGERVVVHGRSDVLALSLKDGKTEWRFRVPFSFKIQHALTADGLMILADDTETVALELHTTHANGEVAWQVKEEGDIYCAPYVAGNRLISVRKSPDSVTARHPGTGRLTARLRLPPLSRVVSHPMFEDGQEARPVAHFGDRLLVTDGWYYILIDTTRMKTVWKRLIDHNDPAVDPPLRFAMNDRFLAVLKKDFDSVALHGLDVASGKLLWEIKDGKKNKGGGLPLASLFVVKDRVYGTREASRGSFFLEGLDAATGKRLLSWESKGYHHLPIVRILPALYGHHLALSVQDNQDFHMIAFDPGVKKAAMHIKRKGVGPFGLLGRASRTVQDGQMALWTENKLTLTAR